MLLLALTLLYADSSHSEITRAALQGEIPRALRMGSERLERLGSSNSNAMERAELGQVIGGLLLACGREAEAEEIFQRQLKTYESISRKAVRWHGSLDKAALLLHLNQPARALEAYAMVLDDREAPRNVRIRALAGAGVASVRSSGQYGDAMQFIDAAKRMSETIVDVRFRWIIEAISLEMTAMRRERAREALSDHGFCQSCGSIELSIESGLVTQLEAAAQFLEQLAPLASARLRCLASLTSGQAEPASAAAQLRGYLSQLTECSMYGLEIHARVEAGLVLIGIGATHAAAEVLNNLIFDEQQVHRSRYAMDLQYCLAKLHARQGRHVDAMRLYRSHIQQIIGALQGGKAPRAARLLDSLSEPSSNDCTHLRLPLRYRRAYQYMIEELHNDSLSVRQVASHIGVTERALQLAFRSHLGVTPAELIRMRRMERIRDDLCERSGSEGVLEVALRWGIKNRSTLVHNYRRQYEETPTETLRGSESSWWRETVHKREA